ncbi:hypothetical protein L9F63_019260, partial [Diploptera punctata]
DSDGENVNTSCEKCALLDSGPTNIGLTRCPNFLYIFLSNASCEKTMMISKENTSQQNGTRYRRYELDLTTGGASLAGHNKDDIPDKIIKKKKKPDLPGWDFDVELTIPRLVGAGVRSLNVHVEIQYESTSIG